MPYSHHNTHHHLKFFNNKELDQLYVSVALRFFGLSLIGIFIPIYLLELGYSFFEVVLFFFVLYVCHLLMSYPAAKFAARYGFKHTMVVGLPFLVLFYVLLLSIESLQWPLWSLGILFGISNGMYWTGYHLAFTTSTTKKKRGSQVGMVKMLAALMQVVAPIIGGLVLTYYNFQLLIVATIVFLLASAVPLFLSQDKHSSFTISLKQVFRKEHMNNTLAFMGAGMEIIAAALLWPVVIYFAILGSYTALGVISGLMVFVSVIFMYFVGKLANKHRKKTKTIGSLATTAVWWLRSLVTAPWHIYVVDMLFGLASTSMMIPFTAMEYDKARGKLMKFTVYKEITLQAGKLVALGLLLLFSDSITTWMAFMLGGTASLLHLLF